jgi:hypothetical protein
MTGIGRDFIVCVPDQFRRAASQFMTTVMGADCSSSALRLTGSAGVFRHQVLIATIEKSSSDTGVEQRARRAGLDRRCRGVDRHGHQPAVETEVEQLFPVPAPAGLRTAVHGDLPPRAGIGERPNIHLRGTGFV